MRAKGDPASVQLAEVVERVRGVLSERGEEWLKTSEVREGLGEPLPSQQQVRIALTQLAREGEVERDPPMSDGDATRRTILWRKGGK